MGEHSSCDALVPSIIAEYSIVEDCPSDAFSPLQELVRTVKGGKGPSIGGWERLNLIVDNHLREECTKAEARAIENIQDSDDRVLWFTSFGADWIKSVGALP